MLFPIATFDSFHYFFKKSVWYKLGSDLFWSHQDGLSEAIVVYCETYSLSDSSSSKSILLKASEWGICFPGVYFSSKSKPIGANDRLVILADSVFGISSSVAKRYLNGLWSVCKENCLPRRNCFNLVTTDTISSTARSQLCSAGVNFSVTYITG